MHLLAAGHSDTLAATMTPIGGYRTIAEVVGFNLSHWSRASGGYSPRKAAAAVMVDDGEGKKYFVENHTSFSGA